jgi:hypothetical protein
MFVKNWGGPASGKPVNRFTGAFPVDFAAGRYSWAPRVPVTKQAGVSGQGTTDPLALFNSHEFVQLVWGGQTIFFDPSYGTGPFAGTDDDHMRRNWQNASLDYVGELVGRTVRFEPRISPTDERLFVLRVPPAS